MKQHRRSRKSSSRAWQAVILTAVALAAVGAVAISLQSRGHDDDQSTASPGSGITAVATSVPSGPQSVAGLEVKERLADLGRVSLNTPVRREWVLANRGTTAVTLAQPTIEVLEGC